MPNKSPIEWTDYTSNPIYAERVSDNKRGWACTKISPGCDACYSESMNKRLGTGLAFSKESESKIRFVISKEELAKTIYLDHRLDQKRQTARMFVCDMTDIFHHLVSDERLDQCFEVWEMLSHIHVQVLTKRVDRMASYLGKRWKDRVPSHIWIGASVENQDYTWRIEKLLNTPAAVRYLSCEPLLGPIDFDAVKMGCAHRPLYCACSVECDHPKINWVLVGGESGRSARHCNIRWIEGIRDQCLNARVPVFVKQLGSKPILTEVYPLPDEQIGDDGTGHWWTLGFIKDSKGGKMDEWTEDLRIRQFPSLKEVA